MTEEKKPTKTRVPRAPKKVKEQKDIVKIAQESGDDLSHPLTKEAAAPKVSTLKTVTKAKPVPTGVAGMLRFYSYADAERRSARARGITVIQGALYPPTMKGRSKRGWTTPRPA